MEYEYGIGVKVVQYSGPELEDLHPVQLKEQLKTAFAQMVTEAVRRLGDPEEGVTSPGEIVSHDLLRVGDKLLLTLITRYKKR